MSRTTYSEDEDYPGQLALWEANLNRATHGKRGQAALRDLRAALLAMPHKRLIQGKLAADGDVCTVGALLLVRGYSQAALERESAECVCGDRMTEHDERGVCSHCSRSRAIRRLDAEMGVSHFKFWNPLADVPCQSWRPTASDEDDDSLTVGLAVKAGVPRILAWNLTAQNDDSEYGLGDLEPEARYQRVLAYVERELAVGGSR